MSSGYHKKYAIALTLVFLALTIFWLYRADFSTGEAMIYGVTFSQKYAQELQLDWRKTYLSILDELNVKKLRLVAYWDLLEPERGNYHFTDLDWQLRQAKARQAEVVLAIGYRVPRWPECHAPAWVEKLNETERQEQLLKLLTRIIERYKEDSTITTWQVENEPYLKSFGLCPDLNKKYYKQELEFVRQYDDRPIMITESGELSTWLRAGFLGDYVGTSVYRITWNKLWGYFYYPLPPAYYYLKSRFVKFYTPVKDVAISEMQMEPWLGEPISSENLTEQFKSMDAEKFRKNFRYAKRTGLTPIYFWGAEWWHWLKENDKPELWQEARNFFNPVLTVK